ncbi:MAG: hypothetical protein IT371_11540 [Deltaproteobacteria bacterium]|nr:hypothetical protein [Deltaproteobacteria bacterium]
MSFPWYVPDVPESYRRAGDKARLMYEAELAERAALLYRLGYSKADAQERLRGNARWDFELHGEPPHAQRVAEIVDRVYARRGTGAGGTPSL